MASECRRNRLRRDDIISAAAASFYANGYERTTLASVARHLDVTDKAIYYYFESKDALYLETLETCADRISEVIQSIGRRRDSGLEKIKSFTRAMIGQSEILRLYIRGLPHHLEHTKQGRCIRAAERSHDDTLVHWIEQGIADGSIAPGNPKMLWKWNQGALIWLDVWSRRDKDLGGPDKLVEEALEMLERSLACAPRFNEIRSGPAT